MADGYLGAGVPASGQCQIILKNYHFAKGFPSQKDFELYTEHNIGARTKKEEQDESEAVGTECNTL